MPYEPLTSFIDNPQIHKLIKFGGGNRFPSWTSANMWDFITVLSSEVGASQEGENLVRMKETFEALNIEWCPVCLQALELVDGISRHEAKCLLGGLMSIVFYSEH